MSGWRDAQRRRIDRWRKAHAADYTGELDWEGRKVGSTTSAINIAVAMDTSEFTVDEIQARTGIESLSNIRGHLYTLTKKGLVEKVSLHTWKLSAEGAKLAGKVGKKASKEKRLSGAADEPAANGSAEPQEAVDIGPPPRADFTVSRVIRDSALVRKIKTECGHRCQLCGTPFYLGDGQLYSEAHHLQPLGGEHRGPDTKSNILLVCPNHHAQLDFGAIHLDEEEIWYEKHGPSRKFVRYHNERVFGQV